MDYNKIKSEMYNAFMKAFSLHGWMHLSWFSKNKEGYGCCGRFEPEKKEGV